MWLDHPDGFRSRYPLTLAQARLLRCTAEHLQARQDGGFEGAEVVMWLTMRGALSANVECKFRSYYLPSMAGIATAIYEGTDAPNPAVVERHRNHVASELSGIERLDTYGAWLVERLGRSLGGDGRQASVVGLDERYRVLVEEVCITRPPYTR